MKLPRDLTGAQVVHLLNKYGYSIDRQTGSQIRISSRIKTTEHSITILKGGTLNGILNEVAGYLKKDKAVLVNELFQ